MVTAIMHTVLVLKMQRVREGLMGVHVEVLKSTGATAGSSGSDAQIGKETSRCRECQDHTCHAGRRSLQQSHTAL